MGRRRHDDPDITGVLVVDKPAGVTSHDVVGVARRALGIRRVGHTGTLDPAATGVLVCAVGRATRLVEVLQAGRKTYSAIAVLGISTDSQDADGKVVATADASHLSEHQVCEALGQFTGTIQQVPPMVSAVKVDGRRLYDLARQGVEVERAPRTVTIYDLVMEDWEAGPHAELSFLVTCSAGTYVRTLAHDLGERLGVGGSLRSLRRVANGHFTLDDALTLDDVRRRGEEGSLRATLIRPVDALGHMTCVEVDHEIAMRMAHGQRVALEDVSGSVAPGIKEPIAVVVSLGDGPDRTLVGTFVVRDGVLHPDIVLLRPEEVLA